MKPFLLLSSILTALFSCLPLLLKAQDTAEVEMARKFYGEGKINIVIAVMVIIFAGIVWYLIRLDKKISKLEKEK